MDIQALVAAAIKKNSFEALENTAELKDSLARLSPPNNDYVVDSVKGKSEPFQVVFFSNLHFLSPALSLDNLYDVEVEF